MVENKEIQNQTLYKDCEFYSKGYDYSYYLHQHLHHHNLLKILGKFKLN